MEIHSPSQPSFLLPSIPNHISNMCGNAHVPMRFALYELAFFTVEEKNYLDAVWWLGPAMGADSSGSHKDIMLSDFL